VTYRETKALIIARRTRKAIAKMYDKTPQRAMDYVNAELAEASRREERRAQYLEAIE